jgi:hypothetical protein
VVGLIILLLLIFTGFVKAMMDLSSENYFKTNKKYLNKSDSWINKYKQNEKGLIPVENHWWYFGIIKPKYQEKFPFSSTVFVMFTDFWHLMNTLYLLLMLLIPTLYSNNLLYEFMKSLGINLSNGSITFMTDYTIVINLIVYAGLILVSFELLYNFFKK